MASNGSPDEPIDDIGLGEVVDDDADDDVNSFNNMDKDDGGEETGIDDGGQSSEAAAAALANLQAKKVESNKEEHAIVDCTTSAGPIKMHFHKSWSPNGYERATSLFERGFYDHSHFFRVVPHFLVQFGISYTTDASLRSDGDVQIKDDPKRNDLMPFREGYVSFAGSGKNSRTSQLFIAYDKSQSLGNSPWETPFGEVVEGMESTVRKLHSGYGDMPPWGKGPQQGPIRNRGASYIEQEFPSLDKFLTCTVVRVASLSNSKGEIKAPEENAVKNKSELTRNVRGAAKKTPSYVPSPVSERQQQNPFLKLIAVLGIVVSLIICLGIRRRKKRKTGKSV